MNHLQTTINHTAWHLMNFMMMQIIGYCFRLAFEKELSDLKGLVHPDSFCEMENDKRGGIDIELELLDALEDESNRVLLDSIHRIVNCRNVLAMINNIDPEKALVDKLAIQYANNIHEFGEIMPEDCSDYNTLVLWGYELYMDMFYQLYLCSEMFNQGTTNVVTKKAYDEFNAALDQLMMGNLVPENKNAQLLLGLIEDLQEDCDRIFEND
ncbi:hypothetical protein [Pedobacter heparinus]|uniref:Uncharacterized protein n=1 Tax=Pedobacter heparinus (strain ATCC 13125 / DSM 2366 / CIP 104194 / JCM 7457 / NBRC 12017 / NCIMB 9290 / NRRL B-14731 / HIM 762-3) TaxID=485917 RepID=C6Y3N4_PEDHD|nr:hypothetical protein [Pedobacter heparinus]ACU03313.1 hypothetical protein Phep_1095 [Pedobacter heparinus DSM 2366]